MVTDLKTGVFVLIDIVLKMIGELSIKEFDEIKDNRISVKTVKQLVALCQVSSEVNRPSARSKNYSQVYSYMSNEEREETDKESPQSNKFQQLKKNPNPELKCSYCGKGLHKYKNCRKRLK